MAKKVKVITVSGDTEGFERKVNEFIKDKIVYDIKYQSYYVPKQYMNGTLVYIDLVDRALIIYEEA